MESPLKILGNVFLKVPFCFIIFLKYSRMCFKHLTYYLGTEPSKASLELQKKHTPTNFSLIWLPYGAIILNENHKNKMINKNSLTIA